MARSSAWREQLTKEGRDTKRSLDYVMQGSFNNLKIHTDINHKHYIENILQVYCKQCTKPNLTRPSLDAFPRKQVYDIANEGFLFGGRGRPS